MVVAGYGCSEFSAPRSSCLAVCAADSKPSGDAREEKQGRIKRPTFRKYLLMSKLCDLRILLPTRGTVEFVGRRVRRAVGAHKFR